MQQRRSLKSTRLTVVFWTIASLLLSFGVAIAKEQFRPIHPDQLTEKSGAVRTPLGFIRLKFNGERTLLLNNLAIDLRSFSDIESVYLLPNAKDVRLAVIDNITIHCPRGHELIVVDFTAEAKPLVSYPFAEYCGYHNDPPIFIKVDKTGFTLQQNYYDLDIPAYHHIYHNHKLKTVRLPNFETTEKYAAAIDLRNFEFLSHLGFEPLDGPMLQIQGGVLEFSTQQLGPIKLNGKVIPDAPEDDHVEVFVWPRHDLAEYAIVQYWGEGAHCDNTKNYFIIDAHRPNILKTTNLTGTCTDIGPPRITVNGDTLKFQFWAQRGLIHKGRVYVYRDGKIALK